jgi:hypothetical protein
MAFRITICAVAVVINPVAKHMPMTSLLNFIRLLLEGLVKGSTDKKSVVMHYEVDASLSYSGFRGVIWVQSAQQCGLALSHVQIKRSNDE